MHMHLQLHVYIHMCMHSNSFYVTKPMHVSQLCHDTRPAHWKIRHSAKLVPHLKTIKLAATAPAAWARPSKGNITQKTLSKIVEARIGPNKA